MTPWYMPIVWAVAALYAVGGAALFALAWRSRERLPRDLEDLP